MTTKTGLMVVFALMGSGCAGVDGTALDAPAHEGVDMDALIAENEAGLAELLAQTQQLEYTEETSRWVQQQGMLNRDPVAEMQGKFADSLTADEQSKLESYFVANGVALESLTFSGRIVVEGDVLLDADELLAALDEGVVEKGKTRAALLTGTTGGVPNGPVVLSRCSPAAAASVTSCASVGSVYQFFRPVPHGYYLVVPDSPTFLFNMFVFLASTLENVSGDTIGDLTYNVIRKSEYDALPELTRLGVFSIRVAYSTGACGGAAGAAACNVFPQMQITVLVPNPPSVISRLAFGPYLGIVSTAIAFDTLPNEGRILHELLHGMGMAHPLETTNPQPQGLYVPGTNQNVVSSVMVASTSNPLWSQTLTAEDIDMMRTLYAPGSFYSGTYSTVNAN